MHFYDMYLILLNNVFNKSQMTRHLANFGYYILDIDFLNTDFEQEQNVIMYMIDRINVDTNKIRTA